MNESTSNPGQSDMSTPKDPNGSRADALTSSNHLKATSTSRRSILGGMAGAALASINAACSMGTDPVQWDEEVQLIDGRVIVVRQKRSSENLYDGDRVNIQPTLGYLKFLLPEIQSTPIEWSDKFMPLILNVHEGAVYVGGSPFVGRQFNSFGAPRSGWVVQRYNAATKKWERIPASKTPEPIRKTNLLIDLVPPPEMKLMTIAVKIGKDFNGRSRTHPEMLSLDPSRKSEWARAISDSDLTD